MKLISRLLIGAFDTIRPFFGFRYLACIYPISCSDYAKNLFVKQPWYKALPKIVLRVVSCNPLTKIINKYSN